MSSKYLDWLKDLRDAPRGTPAHNRWLCEIFPWLAPAGTHNYEYTKLDEMPQGWNIAFGEQMCFEIKELLEEVGWEYDYQIIQIKEKWGYLHWYDENVPDSIFERLQKVIYKYEELSKHTCVICGAPATKISKGWISPYCDMCIERTHIKNFVPIKEFYKNV